MNSKKSPPKKRSDPGNGREPRPDDDYTEFERQSGFAGERAYPTGWRPVTVSGGRIGKPGLDGRGLRESQETLRSAGPDHSPGADADRGQGPAGRTLT